MDVDKGHHLLADVVIEQSMPPAAMRQMRTLVHERLVIVRADAEHFDPAIVDEPAERTDQAVALDLPFVPVAGREGQQRRTPMPEDRYAHVVPQTGRVPVMMFDVHPQAIL